MATRHLIQILTPALTSFADVHPPSCCGRTVPMSPVDIKASLAAPSAKVWPRERDDNDVSLLVDDGLTVFRWLKNEEHASFNKGFWRRSPRGSGEVEIKGALLWSDTEYVPEGKRDRSFQIHHFGFT